MALIPLDQKIGSDGAARRVKKYERASPVR